MLGINFYFEKAVLPLCEVVATSNGNIVQHRFKTREACEALLALLAGDDSIYRRHLLSLKTVCMVHDPQFDTPYMFRLSRGQLGFIRYVDKFFTSQLNQMLRSDQDGDPDALVGPPVNVPIVIDLLISVLGSDSSDAAAVKPKAAKLLLAFLHHRWDPKPGEHHCRRLAATAQDCLLMIQRILACKDDWMPSAPEPRDTALLARITQAREGEDSTKESADRPAELYGVRKLLHGADSILHDFLLSLSGDLRPRPWVLFSPECLVPPYGGEWQHASGLLMPMTDDTLVAWYKHHAFTHDLRGSDTQDDARFDELAERGGLPVRTVRGVSDKLIENAAKEQGWCFTESVADAVTSCQSVWESRRHPDWMKNEHNPFSAKYWLMAYLSQPLPEGETSRSLDDCYHWLDSVLVAPSPEDRAKELRAAQPVSKHRLLEALIRSVKLKYGPDGVLALLDGEGQFLADAQSKLFDGVLAHPDSTPKRTIPPAVITNEGLIKLPHDDLIAGAVNVCVNLSTSGGIKSAYEMFLMLTLIAQAWGDGSAPPIRSFTYDQSGLNKCGFCSTETDERIAEGFYKRMMENAVIDDQRLPILKWLVENQKVDLHTWRSSGADHRDESAMVVAVQHDAGAVVGYLLDQGMDPNGDDFPALDTAILLQRWGIVQTMVGAMPVMDSIKCVYLVIEDGELEDDVPENFSMLCKQVRPATWTAWLLSVMLARRYSVALAMMQPMMLMLRQGADLTPYRNGFSAPLQLSESLLREVGPQDVDLDVIALFFDLRSAHAASIRDRIQNRPSCISTSKILELLNLAVDDDRVPLVRQLLDAVKITQDGDQLLAEGQRLLRCARSAKVADMLLRLDWVRVDDVDVNGNTWLMRAILECNVSLVAALLHSDKHVNVNHTNREGRRALSIAWTGSLNASVEIQKIQYHVMREYLLWSPDLEIDFPIDADGNTPIMYCLLNNEETLAARLLSSNKKLGLGQANTNDDTALMLAINKIKVPADLEVVRQMLKGCFGELNRLLSDADYMEGLLRAACSSDISSGLSRQLIYMLLYHDPRSEYHVMAFDFTAQKPCSPLAWCFQYSDERGLGLLLGSGLNASALELKAVDPFGRNALFYAIDQKDNRAVSSIVRLCQQGDCSDVLNKPNPVRAGTNRRPLCQAIQQSNVAVIQALLSCRNTQVNYQDERGYTPLMQAVALNKYDVVGCFLQSEANIGFTLTNGHGEDVLDIAARNESVAVFKALLMHCNETHAEVSAKRYVLHALKQQATRTGELDDHVAQRLRQLARDPAAFVNKIKALYKVLRFFDRSWFKSAKKFTAAAERDPWCYLQECLTYQASHPSSLFSKACQFMFNRLLPAADESQVSSVPREANQVEGEAEHMARFNFIHRYAYRQDRHGFFGCMRQTRHSADPTTMQQVAQHISQRSAWRNTLFGVCRSQRVLDKMQAEGLYRPTGLDS